MFRHLILVVFCSSLITAMNTLNIPNYSIENCFEKFLTRVKIFDAADACLFNQQLKPQEKAYFYLPPQDISIYIEYLEQDEFKHLDTIIEKKEDWALSNSIWIGAD